MQLSTLGLILVCLVAFGTGLSKTGIQGLGIVLVSVAAMAMPARTSTGFILPLLVMGDFMAVAAWRRSVAWRRLLGLLPWTALGILGGFFLMGRLDDALFKPLLGGFIIFLVVLDVLRRRLNFELGTGHPALAAVVGILAGASTMVANAAGPIMAVYLLAMSLPKEEYVGTTAAFFCIINLFKVPFSLALGLITWPSFRLDLLLCPLVLAGGVLGIFVVRRLPQKAFNAIAQVLAALGGLKLFF